MEENHISDEDSGWADDDFAAFNAIQNQSSGNTEEYLSVFGFLFNNNAFAAFWTFYSG